MFFWFADVCVHVCWRLRTSLKLHVGSLDVPVLRDLLAGGLGSLESPGHEAGRRLLQMGRW